MGTDISWGLIARRMPRGGGRTVFLRGWRLYGPDRCSVDHFFRIGTFRSGEVTGLPAAALRMPFASTVAQTISQGKIACFSGGDGPGEVAVQAFCVDLIPARYLRIVGRVASKWFRRGPRPVVVRMKLQGMTLQATGGCQRKLSGPSSCAAHQLAIHGRPTVTRVPVKVDFPAPEPNNP